MFAETNNTLTTINNQAILFYFPLRIFLFISVIGFLTLLTLMVYLDNDKNKEPENMRMIILSALTPMVLITIEILISNVI